MKIDQPTKNNNNNMNSSKVAKKVNSTIETICGTREKNIRIFLYGRVKVSIFKPYDNVITLSSSFTAVIYINSENLWPFVVIRHRRHSFGD